MPYAIRKKADEILDELLKEEVIKLVNFLEFTCPIVDVKKPDGKVRVCGNYKLTANKVLRVEQYQYREMQQNRIVSCLPSD